MKFSLLYAIAQPLLLMFFKILFFARCYGRKNVPKTGGLIVCANHKSNFDPPLVGGFLPRQLRFLAKKELFNTNFKKWFLDQVGAIPIVRGGNEIGILKTSINLLKEGNAMSIFPEGTRNLKDISNVKSGAVLFAIKAKVPILPTAIIGKYKLFSGLKLVFGKPKYYTEYYDKKLSQEELHNLTVELMNEIYALAGEKI